MTETVSHTREIPEPQFEILKKTLEEVGEHEEVHQWHVKTKRKHNVRIIHPVESGKVKPPQYGGTDHVLVTTRLARLGDHGTYAETTVYGSDPAGEFYNAPLYVTQGIREVWEAMYAIGEL